LKYLFPKFNPDYVVLAAKTLTSLQSGHIINGNPLTSSISVSRSTAVGRGAAATTTRGVGCRATLATLDRLVQVVDEDA
jgi:hypothetical protein